MTIEEKYNLELRSGDLGTGHNPELAKFTTTIWAESVRMELMKIEASEVGGLLLRSIKWHAKRVIIYPYVLAACNGTAAPAILNPSSGLPIYSILHVSPSRYWEGSTCAKKVKDQGGVVGESHELLFHELVHAFRHVSRAQEDDDVQSSPLAGGLLGYRNSEEFIAVLVTNIYASANGKKGLRAGHRDHRVMPDELEGSFKFFQVSSRAFERVDAFCQSNKGFCRALAKIKAPFNPIRAIRTDRDKARRMSDSARARHRDVMGDLLVDVAHVLPLIGIKDLESLMK